MAAKRTPASFYQIGPWMWLSFIAERIDVEGADNARIQAFEIEYLDVVVQAGHRFQNVTAVLHGVYTGIVGANCRGNQAEGLQFT